MYKAIVNPNITREHSQYQDAKEFASKLGVSETTDELYRKIIDAGYKDLVHVVDEKSPLEESCLLATANRQVVISDMKKMFTESTDWTALSDEQKDTLVTIVRDTMTTNESDPQDASKVLDVIYQVLEDVPGVEDDDVKRRTASDLLDLYFEKF